MKLLTLVLIFTSSVLMQSSPQTIPIAIQNPSFQGTSGWQFGPDSGVMQSNGNAYAGTGGSFSQDLGVNPATVQKPSAGWPYVTEGTYELKFSVANYFPNYPGYYEAKISFGTQELCETTGWGTRNFTEVTLICPSSGYLILDKSLPAGGLVQSQNNLVITFTVNDGSVNGGWPILFKGPISLTFTPN